MRINTNTAAMNAVDSASLNSKLLTNSLEKLSSGLTINKSSDDASGMSIADKLRTQKNSLIQSIDNGNSALALIQIADKGMSEQSNILDIVKVKVLQANSDTTSDEGKRALGKDINKLLSQLNSIASQTNYNGIHMLQYAGAGETSESNNAVSLNFVLGEQFNNLVSTSSNIQANTSGLGLNAPDASGYTLSQLLTDTSGNANVFIDKNWTTIGNYISVLDKALTDLNTMRSDFGSVQGQIESSLRNIITATTNITTAESVIRDVDYTKESANFTKYSLVGESSTYALAQANMRPNDMLKLLQ